MSYKIKTISQRIDNLLLAISRESNVSVYEAGQIVIKHIEATTEVPT